MIEIKINGDGSCNGRVSTDEATGYKDLHRALIVMYSIAVAVYGEKTGEIVMNVLAKYFKNGTIKREYEELMQEIENAKK